MQAPGQRLLHGSLAPRGLWWEHTRPQEDKLTLPTLVGPGFAEGRRGTALGRHRAGLERGHRPPVPASCTLRYFPAQLCFPPQLPTSLQPSQEHSKVQRAKVCSRAGSQNSPLHRCHLQAVLRGALWEGKERKAGRALSKHLTKLVTCS